jgi:hypothetical protein
VRQIADALAWQAQTLLKRKARIAASHTITNRSATNDTPA